jgi:hypothetical protein
MTVIAQSENERARRKENVRELRAALQQGETLERRAKRREDRADEWAGWLHEKMASSDSTDPVALLPDILAKVEQTIDDRVAVAISEIKATLRGALK